MKKLLLIKQINDIQAGHIYEHIFCTQLAEFFRSNSLYSYIDYEIDAKTYYSGYVKLEVILYSKAALKHQKTIRTFSVVVDDDAIDGAVLKIMAEKQADLIITDSDKLLIDLQGYNSLTWSSLDSVDTMTNMFVNKDSYIQLFSRSPRQFLTTRQSIVLNKEALAEHPRYVIYPLFMVVSRFLMSNLQQIIADESFCYSYDDFVTIARDSIKNTNLYRIDKRQETALTIEKEVTEAFLLELFGHSFIDTLETFLRSVSYKSPGLAPDDDSISENVGVLVGAKGWLSIGTRNNILHVLRHTTIVFKLGQTTQRISVASLLERSS